MSNRIEDALRRITADPPLSWTYPLWKGLCVRAVVENPGAETRFGENLAILEGLAVQIQGQGPSERRLGERPARMTISWWVVEGLFANLSQNVEKPMVF